MVETPDTEVVVLTPTRIITLAMTAGIVMFAAVAFFVAPLNPDSGELARFMLMAMGGLGATGVIGYTVLRTATLARVRRKAETAQGGPVNAFVFPAYNTVTLIGSALCEGFGLFGVVIFLLTGHRLALTAAALSVVLLVLRIPTMESYRRFRDSVLGANA